MPPIPSAIRFESDAKLKEAFCRDRRSLLLTIDLGDVGYGRVSVAPRSGTRKPTDQVNDTAGVAPLVVVPGYELDEVRVERNTGLGVEDGRVLIAVQVGGDNVILGVREDALIRLVK